MERPEGKYADEPSRVTTKKRKRIQDGEVS